MVFTSISTSTCARHDRVTAPLVAFLLVGLLGCGSGGDDGDFPCSAQEGKADLLDIMEDVYLWNDEPDQASKYSLDLRTYTDEYDLLDFLRYRPETFDRGFSYITTTSDDEQFFGEGEYPGFGFFLSDLDQGEIFITEVIPDSPAETQGMQRGDQILAIGDTTIDSMTEIEDIFFALGPAQLGVARSFDLEAPNGDLRTVNLTTEVIVIDPLPFTDVFDVNGDMVGYMLFHTFIGPAVADLRQVFAVFKAMGVSRLIVDLRYNGGGLLDVAATFNDLLGGPSREDMVQFRLTFNSKYSDSDEDILFVHETDSIDLDQIVFITTGNSASASELIINSLLAYTEIDVQIVGGQTFGKPVGQVPFGFCDGALLLRAVAFRVANKLGQGDYFDGLAPDCQADDDLSTALGDPMETSLAAALTLIETDMCPVTVTAARAAPSATKLPDVSARGTTPWRREARVY